ncbi:MAG: glycerol kinase GlpK [Clostridiales bacterium]|nr:glycerol kinase GlpK [Clostridiales bacterium]
MRKYIMALDQGTTSSRCILFDKDGESVSQAQVEHTQIYPNPGWVEHNAEEILRNQISVAKEAIEKGGINPHEIAAIGITNQRETTVIWEKNTGRPIYNAIVWQCRRTADYCEQLKSKPISKVIKDRTGLYVDPYFSATKIKWILDNVEGAREKAEKGELLFGTIDSWLIWKLTKGKVHVTDYTNASRTMLFDIKKLEWYEEILKELNIPKSILPQVKQSSEVYGYTDPSIFGAEIPIAAIAGDQQAGFFGHRCFEPGTVKNTYGTGGFLLMNTGEKPVSSNNGLLTTIAWGIDNRVYYALEGSIFVAGAAIQWLRDELKILNKSSESEEMAKSVTSTNGTYFVPAFVGLGAPYWDSYARGTIVGITRGTNRNHLVRAALESIAYQTYDVLKAMEEDSDIALSSLKVDGGASQNEFLVQFQADIIGKTVEQSSYSEITALGVAYLAGLAVGYWDSINDIKGRKTKLFEPNMDDKTRDELLKGWHRAVKASRFID